VEKAGKKIASVQQRRHMAKMKTSGLIEKELPP